MRTLSLSGAKDFITFVDDFSEKVFVLILKSKDEMFERFKQWKTLVNNQTRKRIKYLWIDNGLEYYGDECSMSDYHLSFRQKP